MNRVFINIPYKLRSISFLFVLVLALKVGSAHAEDQAINQPSRPKVEIIARALSDSILIRWAPNNSLLWDECIKSGFILERTTLIRDGKLLELPEHVVLTEIPIKPQPLDKWEEAVKRNKYAAIAAQALFGETFEAEHKGGADLFSVMTKVRERDSRFSFAQFSADQSPEVAKLSGLWFTDVNVKKNERYLYQVYVANSALNADTGSVLIGTINYQPLPKPIDLRATFGDRKAILEWNDQLFRNIFTSYFLERSDDGGKSYHQTTEEPLVTLTNPNNPNPEFNSATDSLPDNYKIYYYRLRGITSFGEVSEPSEVVSGSGYQPIPEAPHIIEKRVINNEQVFLKWEFPDSLTNVIDGFKVARSSNPQTGFEFIADSLNRNVREYTDMHPLLNNYYIIVAFNKYSEELHAAPILVQLVDSTPPIPPVNLKGGVDKRGVVMVSWDKNREDDIYGYRVYRANDAGEEFSQITSTPISDTIFSDTISLNTLTKYIYYRVMAIDHVQNHSTFSEILQLKRPDTIPPVSPVFTEAISTSESVMLKWINSSSSDVQSESLYRSIANSTKWKLLGTFSAADSINSYNDATADSTASFRYTIIARDLDGNESTPAIPVDGKKINLGIGKSVEKLDAIIDRESESIKLVWKMPTNSVDKFIVYKSIGDGELEQFAVVNGDVTSFIDNQLLIQTNYKYAIKVIYLNGDCSNILPIIDIRY